MSEQKPKNRVMPLAAERMAYLVELDFQMRAGGRILPLELMAFPSCS
jgi:hypothetical protein